MVFDHHQQIEQTFADVRAAESEGLRRLAQKQLGALLTGHSLAESLATSTLGFSCAHQPHRAPATLPAGLGAASNAQERVLP